MSNNTTTKSAAKIKLDSFDDLFGSNTTQGNLTEQIITFPLQSFIPSKTTLSGWQMMKKWKKQQEASVSTGY